MNIEQIGQVIFMKKAWQKSIGVFIGTLLLSFLIFTLVGVNFESTNTIEFNNRDIFIYILTNNIKVYVVLFLGLFLLRIPTYVTLIYNAFILGFAFSAINSFSTALSILAHGIFEIVAFIISATIAFNSYEHIKKNKFPFALLFTCGLLLLIVAALVETYVSPIILKGAI